MSTRRSGSDNARMAGLIALVAYTAIGAGCGGSSSSSNSSNPAGPSNTPGPTPACRTYPTTANVTTTTLGLTQNARLTGAFNSGTSQATITIMFVGGALCSTAVHSYRSTSDFVDEVRVNPPVSLELSTTTTNSGPCGSGTFTVTSAYDAQRRLTQLSGPAGATTYTAWDASGRPTTGTISGGGAITNVYNESARTVTQTQVTGGGTTVTTMTYDANGAQTMVVNSTSGIVSTTTFTNTSTASVCK